MKFFLEKPLKIQAAYILGFLMLISVGEFFLVRSKLNSLQELHHTADYARKAQNKSQHIALQLQLFLNGHDDIPPEIIHSIKEQDQMLSLLGNGGRLEQTNIFIKKPSRLPQISLHNLQESWLEYKNSIYVLIGEKPQQPQTAPVETVESSGTAIDSAGLGEDSVTHPMEPRNESTPVVENFNHINAEHVVAGQWKFLSSLYDRLIADLNEEVEKQRSSFTIFLFLLIVFDLLFFSTLYFLFNRHIIKPLKLIEVNTSQHLHTFDLPQNEIGKTALQVNEVIEQLKDASDFVSNIGEGNLNMDYKELDSQYITGKYKLADALVSMQSKLKTINEEDSKRKWANEGLTKFVDILRSSESDINILGDKIISALVQYTGSNQGGLYIVNDDDQHNKYLDLVSLFAFDIKKFEKQKIKPGEGILGQVFLEKEITYLTQLPNDYIRITSGLGGINPSALLAVPLKIDQEVYGIVELASFREFQPHEITFVEKLGETIASTLASVKAAQRNRKLLEESKLATEAMRSQEEEMRQNMEELQATQEEVARKERDYVQRIKQLEDSLQESVSLTELESARQEAFRKEQAYAVRLRELEERLENNSPQNEDWQHITEIEKALKFNLEAIQITQEELNKKKK